MPHGFPQWILWPARFEVLDRLHRTLSDPKWESCSTNMQAIQLRKVLDFSAITRAGLLIYFNPNGQLGGQDFLNDALQQVQALLD